MQDFIQPGFVQQLRMLRLATLLRTYTRERSVSRSIERKRKKISTQRARFPSSMTKTHTHQLDAHFLVRFDVRPCVDATRERFRRQSSPISRVPPLSPVQKARQHRLHAHRAPHSRARPRPRALEPRAHLGKCLRNSHFRSFAPVDTCSPPSAPTRSATSSSRPTRARAITQHRSRLSPSRSRPRVRLTRAVR